MSFAYPRTDPRRTLTYDKPRAGARMRWLSLLLLSVSNAAGYYVYDSLAPIADLFHAQLGFSFAQIGALNAVYSLPNIGLAFVGGLLADRYGASRIAVASTAISLIGSLLMAVGSDFTVMLAGRFLFGVGGETSLVAMVACVSSRFRAANLGIAFALFFCMARLGSYAADLAPAAAGGLFKSWQPPLILSAGISGISFLAAAMYWLVNRSKDNPHAKSPPSRIFSWPSRHDVRPGFWKLAVVGALFYAVVFPFRSTFSIDFFQHARGLTLADAGIANSWMFLAALVGTPLAAAFSDKFRLRREILILGLLLLCASFALLFFPACPFWVTSALIGVAYSVVPSVLWPEAAGLTTPERQGMAFGALTVLQNLGMTVSNFVAGRLNDFGGAGAAHPDGYLPMLTWFGIVSVLGLIVATRLPRSQ
jgi:MFS family permease